MSARILIVDDEDIVVRSCLRILAETGYTLDVARSGAEALRKIDGATYDVLLLDIMMPQINGLEVLQHVRQKRPASEVIMFTGLSQAQTALREQELGAFAYLPKPFDPEQLRELIAQALARRHARAEHRAP